MRWYHIASALVTVIWLVGCTAPFDVVAPPNDERIYSVLYPLYAELCAVSQIKKKPRFGVDTSGGPGGHAVFYLNGVCRDRGAGYPTLVLCTPDALERDQGVGLSVNAHFQNANWVATDGRDFFFQGELTQGERLTPVAYARTQKMAEAKGIYDGVIFYPAVFDDMPAGMDRRDFMYEVSVATDYAIGFGRDRYCARVPVDRAQMVKMVNYLNGINAIYHDGKKKFVWNVVENNCSHLAHNALAAAGIWEEWPTDRFIAISAFDFPVPKNEFVNLMRRTNDIDITDLRTLYRDGAARRSLVENGRLPTKPGGLAEAERMWQDNDIYDTHVNLIFYDDPVFGAYKKHFHEIFVEPRYIDMRSNLKYFAALYGKIKAEKQSDLQDSGLNDATSSVDFLAFTARFYAYIDREIASVNSKINALVKLPSLAGNFR
jgi:hypothetical protein